MVHFHTKQLSISSVLGKLKRGLQLNPSYQRNSVWTRSQKQLLIDSILSKIPIPSLYFNEIAEDQEDVVDGQQRLRTIQEYTNGDFVLSEDSAFGAKGYKQLSEKLREEFDDYQLSIVKLVNWSDEQVEDMFLRLQDGSPLNAAEKRRAITGTFRDVVKELSMCSFFENCVGFSNNRYGHEDAVAKTLHLIINGIIGISPAQIRKTYTAYDRIKTSDPNIKKLIKAYNFINKGFESKKLQPSLKKWSAITLPHVIVELATEYDTKNHARDFADSFMDLEKERHSDRQNDEATQNVSIVNFNDAARADDPARLKSRHDFLKSWFLRNIDGLEPLPNRDKMRVFTQDQRVILYSLSNGKCGICGDSITQDAFDADHIKPYAEGGSTSLNNGRALCIRCNRGRKS